MLCNDERDVRWDRETTPDATRSRAKLSNSRKNIAVVATVNMAGRAMGNGGDGVAGCNSQYSRWGIIFLVGIQVPLNLNVIPHQRRMDENVSKPGEGRRH